MPDLINDGLPFRVSRDGALGLSRHRVRTLLRDYQIRPLFRGVLVDSRVPDSRDLRCLGLALVLPPRGVICHSSAAWAMRIDAFQPKDRFLLTPQCMVPHGTSRSRQPGVRCIQGYLPDSDVMIINGLCVTTPSRTTVDLMRTLLRPFALSVADAMVRAELVTIAELARRIRRLKHFPGIVQARALLRLIDPRAESPGESWLRLRLVDAGFPFPRPQFEVIDHRGRVIARIDLAYPEIKLAMEYDGAAYHTHEKDRQHDEERRVLLSDAYGWRFEPATKADVLGTDPAYERNIGKLLGIEPLPRFW
jgi:very-short-patch-repair endonuclease